MGNQKKKIEKLKDLWLQALVLLLLLLVFLLPRSRCQQRFVGEFPWKLQLRARWLGK